jgi:glutaconate CoA-transferase subunit A
LPFGAHPCGCGSLYQRDDAHCRQYLNAAKDEAGFKAYLDQYVYGVRNHQGYLERVGMPSPSREAEHDG